MKMIDMPSRVSVRRIPNSSVGLLRRQHGRRLVEDQDVGAAVERLQDLDPLLLPDARCSRSARSGRSWKLEAVGEVAGRALAAWS